MRRLGSVQQKLPCVFVTEVIQEQSRKRECQQFQVVATKNVNPMALESNVDCALATEKLDGTCCYVSMYKGQPYLWARLDRKPNKQADKKFKKYQHTNNTCEGFTWDVEQDFKSVPESWIPAHRVQHRHGQPVPDQHGHIPGWVPVEKNNKQYCWHSSVVDHDAGVALVLRPREGDDALEITVVPLSELLEQTLELIGTNVNGNPYGMGNKKRPVHTLVRHGGVPIRSPPPLDSDRLQAWFQDGPEGNVEGIVWHCHDGSLFKVHRHHLGLRWPVDGGAFLSSRPVLVHVDWVLHGRQHHTDDEADSTDLFTALSRLSERRFSRLQDVHVSI